MCPVCHHRRYSPRALSVMIGDTHQVPCLSSQEILTMCSVCHHRRYSPCSLSVITGDTHHVPCLSSQEILTMCPVCHHRRHSPCALCVITGDTHQYCKGRLAFTGDKHESFTVVSSFIYIDTAKNLGRAFGPTHLARIGDKVGEVVDQLIYFIYINI